MCLWHIYVKYLRCRKKYILSESQSFLPILGTNLLNTKYPPNNLMALEVEKTKWNCPCLQRAYSLDDASMGSFRMVKNQSFSINFISIGSVRLSLSTWVATPRASNWAYLDTHQQSPSILSLSWKGPQGPPNILLMKNLRPGRVKSLVRSHTTSR